MGRPTERQIREFEKVKKRAKKLGLGDMFMDKKHATRTSEEQQDLFKQGKSKLDGYKNLSKHQTGRAVDAYFKGVKSDKEQIKRLKKLKQDARNEGIDYGEIPWDMGHFEFEIPKKEITDAKGKYLFGSPPMKYETENRIPELLRRPVDEEEVKKQQEAQLAQELQENVAVSEGMVAAQTPAGRAVAAESINNNQLLNEEQKKQAKQEMNDPQAIINTYIANKLKKQQGEKPGVKNQFMEALTFFLPNIAGLATGALIGGTEGAVAGEQRGGQLGAGLRDYKMKQAELAKKDELSDKDILNLQLSAGRLSLGKQKEERVKESQEKGLDIRERTLEEKKEGRSLREKQFDFTKRKQEYTKIKDASQRKITVAKDYNSDSIVKAAKGGITQAQKAKKNLDRNNPISASVVVRSLARLAGEKGVMTEADVNDFRTSPAWDEQAQQIFERATTGKLTKDNKKYMSQIIGDMEDIERELLDKQTNTYVTQFSSLINEDAKSMGARLRGDFMSSQEIKLFRKFKQKYPNVSEDKLRKKILSKTRGAK